MNEEKWFWGCALAVGSFALWQYATRGVFIERNKLSFLLDKPIAHRGLWDKEIPENSLAAFQNALNIGLTSELDVQWSKDHVLMVFHDHTLERMTGQKGCISDYTAKQLQQMSLKRTTETIPTLSQVLSLVDSAGGLLIELKTNPHIEAMAAVLDKLLADYHGDVAVQSFDPRAVAYFAHHSPQIVRGILSGNLADAQLPPYQRILMSNLWLNHWVQPHFIAYEAHCLPKSIVSYLKKQGLPILGWTITNEQQWHQALLYCTNVIAEGEALVDFTRKIRG